MASGALAAFPASAHDQTTPDTPDDLRPTLVTIDANLPAGEIHVLPDQFRLYLTQPGQQALRFAIGVARPGLYEPGRYTVGAKREWPFWRPTPAMLARVPEKYAPFAAGMPGGPDNPLGARAFYLFDEAGQDTLLRIHGTNAPRTIGTAVSNGCARLTNDDIVVLYDAVPVGAPVFLHLQGA
jgi:lipoprotein-anchoring transpeptidase ErfK/SrfK